jgi:hypothetical protein
MYLDVEVEVDVNGSKNKWKGGGTLREGKERQSCGYCQAIHSEMDQTQLSIHRCNVMLIVPTLSLFIGPTTLPFSLHPSLLLQFNSLHNLHSLIFLSTQNYFNTHTNTKHKHKHTSIITLSQNYSLAS